MKGSWNFVAEFLAGEICDKDKVTSKALRTVFLCGEVIFFLQVESAK